MTTIAEAIEIGLAHHRRGQLQQAEQVYRRILQADPRNAGALHLLGLVALQVGRHDAAVQLISDAIRLDGRRAVYHANLGEAYRALGRMDQARTCYEQALRIEDLPEAQNNLGTILQASGQLDAAIDNYRTAIAKKPNYADAHNNLGTAYQERGQWDLTVQCYLKAVEVDPAYAKGHYNLGVAFGIQKRLDESRAAFEQAIALAGNYAEAHYGLAMVLQEQQQWTQAEAAYQQALRLRPTLAEAASSLGTLYQAQGKLDQAIAAYEQALRVSPTYAEAYYNWGTALKAQDRASEAADKYRHAIRCKPTLADAHYNLGIVLQGEGHLDLAASAYEEAVRLRPDFSLAHNNLGNVYKLQDRSTEAIACYERAIECQPHDSAAYNNLGSMLQQHGQLAQTIGCYQKALRSNPDCAEAYCNLGTALQEQGKNQRALTCYKRSLELRPDFPEAHYNLALLYLSQERFVEAWPEFAWRRQCKFYPQRAFAQPLWDGSPLNGRTLLVHAEQGLGDTMLFVRYLSEVRKRGGKPLLEAQAALVPLLRCWGFDNVVAAGSQLPPFDAHAPLLDLPCIFGTTLENLPAEVPYVAADPRLVDRWREALSGVEGFKIGIAWQGNKAYSFDRNRSIALAQFETLASVDGVRLFSLQKRDGTEQLASVSGTFEVHDLAQQLDEETAAFMDTAAVMKNMDLVITSDTATAHLAGALGVKVWVALCAAPDWRWFLERADSPWYPTMRLFRQRTLGDWTAPFEEMAEELARLVQSSSGC